MFLQLCWWILAMFVVFWGPQATALLWIVKAFNPLTSLCCYDGPAWTRNGCPVSSALKICISAEFILRLTDWTHEHVIYP